MLHSKKKEERKNKMWPEAQTKRVKAQSANVCQRHSVKRKERKHKVLVKKNKLIEKNSGM